MADGQLTAAQYEIMQVVWASMGSGATVTDIWQEIAKRRPVGRTTILNLVMRLEQRGWLKRLESGGRLHFLPAVSQENANERLATEFVSDFFGGSTANLMMSLLGSKRLSTDEIVELRRLLEEQSS